MRKSGAVMAALAGVPVLLAAGSAAALTITFEQVTGAIGGAALGIVGGPAAGFAGNVLGREVGRKLHPPARQIDLTDLRSRPHVTPINDGPMLDPPVDDRVVDSTPVRMIELKPAEADAQTYLASAPRSAAGPRTYLASARRGRAHVRTYLASSPKPAARSETPEVRAIPVSNLAGDNPTAPPGTLDYQLNQLNAGRAADDALVQKVADIR